MNMKPQLYISILFLTASVSVLGQRNLPTDLLIGSATAAYQIEGAWNENGKGENIWDRFTHKYPDKILDGSTGDVACDSYHKFREDVRRLKDMKAQFYRFSLSWSRILPNGLAYKINPDGIRYYNQLIDELIANDIEPMVTLFHWDTPQPLEDVGGFTNELMVQWFTDYARVAFDNFGGRVKLWLTFNEPKQTCLQGYGGNEKAPAYMSSGVGDYICAHNLLKAHAAVYHMYTDDYKPLQNGKVSITIDTAWYFPASTSDEDIAAAERMMDFSFGWYTDPVYHPNGNYPQSMRDRIRERSLREGFPVSRLPEFTPDEVEFIKNTYDYFGLNHYTSQMAANDVDAEIGDPSYFKDARVSTYYDESWEGSASPWLKVVPEGFRQLLVWIKNRYPDPALEIYVTENGFSDDGRLQDSGRVNYYTLYLNAMLDAIEQDDVKVRAYAAWSLLDNFEWLDGYENRFGLHHVDFESTEKTRTVKDSATFFTQLLTTRILPPVPGPAPKVFIKGQPIKDLY